MAINASEQSIKEENFQTSIKSDLDNVGLLGNNLSIEVTEGDLVSDFDKTSAILNQLKEFGVNVAIDDFGTGYSNFAHLMRLDVDYIKIDGSMIKDIDTDRTAQTVVETIVQFASKLGMQTVAEFVHSEAIYQKVKELGVDFSQGYYFGQPQPFFVQKDNVITYSSG